MSKDLCLLQFDGILEGAGQETVYATCAHEVAESLLAGYNGTVFCYGQVCMIQLHSANVIRHLHQHQKKLVLQQMHAA